MIAYEAKSCIEVSPDLVRRQVSRFLKWHDDVTYPEDFVEHSCRFHGGIPIANNFPTNDGSDLAIGRFLNFLEEAELPEPRIASWRIPNRDARLDYSVWFLIENVPENLAPFAGVGNHQFDCRQMDLFNMLCFNSHANVVLFRPGFEDVEYVAKSFSALSMLLKQVESGAERIICDF
jgi:hypothetical protein